MATNEPMSLAASGLQHSSSNTSPEDLLLEIATATIQRNVGYPVPQTAATISAVEDARSMCSEQAIQFLALVLPGKAPYTWAAGEWFASVAMSGRRIHDAYVLRVIEVGTQRDHLRPYIRPLLGDRARWLIRQRQVSAHEWAYTMPLVSMEAQLTDQREHEQDIMDMLEVAPLRDLMDTLPINRFIWGEAFATRLLDLIEETYPNAKIYEAAAPYSLLYTAAYHCPLACHQHLLATTDFVVQTILTQHSGKELQFSHKRISETFDELKEKIQHIIAFRCKMVVAIENGE
ncbi:MAG: hypothetical protein AAGK74_07740 [Chloroflexota bacterium]